MESLRLSDLAFRKLRTDMLQLLGKHDIVSHARQTKAAEEKERAEGIECSASPWYLS
jgi:hypothetical protein